MPPKAKPVPKAAAKPAAKATTSTKAGTAARKPGTTGKAAPGGSRKAGPAAKGSKDAAKSAQKAPAKPKPPSKEHLASVQIQKWVRRFLAQCKLQKMKKEKEDYEEMVEKLEKEAFLAIVRKEQEKAEEEHRKEMEMRRRKKQEKTWEKTMLESAFDGNMDDVLTVLKEVDARDNTDGVSTDEIGRSIRARHQLAMVNCEDANGNTPLSEASSGGATEVIQMLIDRGADINQKGQFERTPLYRAAFAGHLEAVQTLLQNGGDPRIYANDGDKPEQVASQDAVKNLLESWDVSMTESLLSNIEKLKDKRREEETKRQNAEMAKFENQFAEAQKVHDAMQKLLSRAYCELEKRIVEHDKCMLTGFKTDITLQCVHDAEHELEMAKIAADEARNKVNQIKLQMREQRKAASGEDEIGVKVNFKELNDVLLRDVGGKIKSDGRWPMLLDPSGRVSTFLRYQDTNFINALNPNHMEPEVIRSAVLGAVRYGKPFVLDFLEVNMFETCVSRFDEVQPGLLEDILNKSILEKEKYLYLVRESDGEEYNKNKFMQSRTQNFKMFLVSKNELDDEIMDRFYVLRVVLG
ncbi:putative IQ motif and ankyrin repeat domain-containing protein [Strongylocentrotus purpuratus]|uniref:IQ motif and ankyrin repeat domain-containing protein n=1 Tax=Strongylocentrotus purpuratus TaxID=7668 RepID=A0A7M7G023_STRPU|nr:putative IQ motif and ankyrin repeat domain-containing protein [Strongylocentrotus purpuratus]|eukprot:XP_001183758.2 PREDICTED: putative IQ motif and ankyrin repeat domain-containing protein [Strongylocentrotus purpuratus]